MKSLTALLLITAASLTLNQPVMADVLLLDAIAEEPVNSSEGLSRPSRGMSMEQVTRQFGEPESKTPWVGDPPITRWYYPGFTVYFEYKHVITSVVDR